nr:transposase [Legionella sp. MW5194]
MQHQCMMTYRELASNVKSNRGIMALLRTKPERLTPLKKAKRDAFLADNPAIEAVYQFQQQLHNILMKKMLTKNRARQLIPRFLEMLDELKQSPFKPLAALGKTLDNWCHSAC